MLFAIGGIASKRQIGFGLRFTALAVANRTAIDSAAKFSAALAPGRELLLYAVLEPYAHECRKRMSGGPSRVNFAPGSLVAGMSRVIRVNRFAHGIGFIPLE